MVTLSLISFVEVLFSVFLQLTKTLGDVFRIMPLIPMLIIPFAELLIPFYVKLGLMPTTFQSKKDKVRLIFKI